MRRQIKLTENELYGLIKESVRRVLKESSDNEYYDDAMEALEMSDGFLDFDDWYPAFQDELDPDEAEEIFNQALRDYGMTS